ncbi:MAG TPA: hypothetical protein GXX37_06065 [Clostridiaceae bacterium]|nr:hypothetical protein [Clostridiaceae bacterium]
MLGRSFLSIPTRKDGDVIVAAREYAKEGVGRMNNDLYTNIGYAVVWCIKYIFIPIGVSVSARIIAERLLQPHPEKQRKKRFKINRF